MWIFQIFLVLLYLVIGIKYGGKILRWIHNTNAAQDAPNRHTNENTYFVYGGVEK